MKCRTNPRLLLALCFLDRWLCGITKVPDSENIEINAEESFQHPSNIALKISSPQGEKHFNQIDRAKLNSRGDPFSHQEGISKKICKLNLHDFKVREILNGNQENQLEEKKFADSLDIESDKCKNLFVNIPVLNNPHSLENHYYYE